MHDAPIPRPERGAYILREPKGIPDLILVTRREDTQDLYKAGAILGVQGYTTRLVMLLDDALFAAQSDEYRTSVLPTDRASVTIYEADSPQETANLARKALFAALHGEEQ